jgi:hypothetical protein
MKWIKNFESKYIESETFKSWFNGSKVVNLDGSPRVVYHGTDKKFNIFSLRYTTQGIIWFTTNKYSIESGEVGASGSGYIMELYVSLKNPAGWEEYERLTLSQLENLGYDGAILQDEGNNYTGFVFNPKQIKIVR